MKIRTRWIFTIILCLLIAIPLAACDGSPAAQSGTLKSQNGVTVEGTFADGAALEAVEVVGEDKILALQSIAEEKYDTDGKVYVYDISVVKDGAKVQPNGKVKVTVSVPYGNRAIYTYNVSTLTFKGNGSLTIDYQVVASNQVYMHGILMEGESSSKNNGNLTFDESCTVTVKVYGEVAEKNGSVDAIYMKTDDIGSGNVTVGEKATLNIDLQCDSASQTYGIFAKGNVAFDGTVDIKMEYTGSGAANNTWQDVFTYSSYTTCSIGTNAKITSVCPGSSGSSLTAFPLVANGAEMISSWTKVLTSEQYFENDDCLVHVWDKCANGVSFKNYSYNKIATPLMFEDKAEYDVPSTVYGGDIALSSIALSASGGSGEYVFSVVSAADGNKNGVGIVSTESNFNKIYVAPTIRGVSEATEITVRVKDKYGYSKTITVNIGEVAAPTYSATVVPWISAR